MNLKMHSLLLAGSALLGTAALVHAQDFVWSSFDADVNGWKYGWAVNATLSQDPARDAAADPNSGSLMVTTDWAAGGESVLQRDNGIADVTGYEKVKLDVYVDPTTPPTAEGDFGSLTLRFRPGWAWPGDVIPLGAITSTGWNHFEAPIPATATGFSGINLHWNSTYTTTTTIWIDNLAFVLKPQAYVWKGFDTDAGGFACNDWGVTHTSVFDPAVDVAQNASSGSLAVEAQFTAGGEVSLQNCSGLGDLSLYNRISMEVYVAEGTAPDPNGNYGTFTIRLRPGWAWPGDVIELGAVTATGWTHLEKALPATATGFAGMNIHWNTAYTTTAKVWLDNIAFVPKAASTPPPTLVFEPSLPGLEVLTSGSGDYSRKNVATAPALAPSLSWVNAGGAVTYAMTINETVGLNANGFSANIMLCATESETIGTSPDWHEPHGIFLEAISDAAGKVSVSVRYKTNAVDAHGIRFTNDGLLINVNNTGLTSLVGTWAITLNGDQVSLSGPGGVTGNGQLPADVTPLFGGNLFALFGAQPNANKDRRISLSRVQVSGPADFAGNLDQDFTKATSLDNNFLETKEEDAGGVRLKPTNVQWRLSWLLPDKGFEVWSSPALKSASWVLSTLTPVTAGMNRIAFVPATNGAEGYFQLRQQ